MAFSHHFDPTVAARIRHPRHRRAHPACRPMPSPSAACSARSSPRAGGTRVAVGYDGRLTSPDLEQALVDGLRASGMEALRIGRGPTPMLYYTATTLETDGAVMVTGSHNPPDYNGFKMMLGRKPFFGQQILQIGALAAAGDVVPEASRHGADGRHRRRLRRPPARRLGRRRPHAESGLGQRQRRRRRRAGEAGGLAAGRAHRAERHHRRPLPGASSGPDRAGEPGATDRRGAQPQGRYRHRLRRRRRPHRPGRRHRRDPVRRPADGGAGARRAEGPSRRARSSPTSRPARCCSTKSPRPAARR